MSPRAKPPTAIPRGYKRSWRNLLINKRYQLRFTLFMAGLAAVLISALGYFVMFYADRTTTIGINRVISEPCQEVPRVEADKAAATPTPDEDVAAPDDVGSGSDSGSGAPGDDAGSDDTGRTRPKVVVGESSMVDADGNPIDMPPPAPPQPAVPPEFVNEVAAHWACELRHAGAVAALHRGRTQILLVLIGTGLLLVLGLAIYGIKMTHRVAGPLYKVTLYLAKMKEGRLDKVWNLRKGDQLVEFYEHFKAAHAGVVHVEQTDIARLQAMLAVVDKDPAKFAAPELAGRVAELRAMLARKEKSLD